MKISDCIKDIEARSLEVGGFSELPQGQYRPDSTAWAIMALEKAGAGASLVAEGRAALSAGQFRDGRVFLPGAPDVFWPTSLAALAWHGDPLYRDAVNRACGYLLEISGNHFNNIPEDPVGHDTSLLGWPWVLGTHSFIAPTVLALLALERMEHAGHPRFLEGIRMIMNRQLPSGGWNYGNTLVYGAELLPFIDTTGMALTAVVGHASEESVKSSIDYLIAETKNCRTPLSLGWALFGLGAWGIFPTESNMWIEETLARQEKFGSYDTSSLSILVLAALGGF